MKILVSSIYLNGHAGLSNLLMSLELGVVAASLTGRSLVLKGNQTPIANVVQYGGALSNRYPSRVTDLVDPGMPWTNAETMDLSAYAMHDICPQPAWETVFHMPAHLSVDSEDFKAFAGRRTSIVTVTDEIQRAPALSLSGGPEARTLSFYSTFFYLDRSAQQRAVDTLRNMKPRPELSEFASRVASDLGPFNAVHIRRGDFKKTLGVTTLDRTPREVIETLDHHFSRDDCLVVLTDEAEDPFFNELRAAYKQIVFLDHHILEHYRADFLDMPAHDSIALAYLSQLVAAHSDDFVGTMTSTFTSMIQRMRGNAGKHEPFKFLWNELPPVDAVIERGRHAFGDDVPLDKGVMIEQRDGPYSWNRFNERLNSGWMREWPESFVDETAMLERTDARVYVEPVAEDAPVPAMTVPEPHIVSFCGKNVAASSNDDDTSKAIARLFEMLKPVSGEVPVGHVRIEEQNAESLLLVDGKTVTTRAGSDRLLRRLYREVVRCFIYERTDLVWLHASAAAHDNRAIVMPGSWGHGKSTLALELYNSGWSFLSDDIVPIAPDSGVAIPFPATPQVRKGARKVLRRDQLSSLPKTAVTLDSNRVSKEPEPVSMIVFPHFTGGTGFDLEPLSPARAVGEMLENCLSFPKNDDETIQALCAMAETLPAYTLRYGDPAGAVGLLMETHAQHGERRLREDHAATA